MDGGFAIFDLGEVDMVGFSADDVNFVEIGFVIAFDDGMAVLF